MRDHAVVECVPNFSEGRDQGVIKAIADGIRSIAGVKLLDIDPGFDTNRTVYTFVGNPDGVLEAALAAARAARALIDMRRHSGAHPRLGALDVCPFVPVSGITMDECVALSKTFAERLASEFGVPVYLYEKAATRLERTSLADIRSGEYEGLAAKLADPAWEPDFGPAAFDPAWGATVTGAREFLIAYNVNLNTVDKKLANEVALSVREGGRLAKNPDGTTAKDSAGNPIRVPGRLKAVRAIGWFIEQYGCAQVSINLLDYRTTPLHEVFEVVKQEAESRGLFVTGSELVGLIPLSAMTESGRHFLGKMGKASGLSDRQLVEVAARTMGLSSVSPFVAEKKIVEWAFSEKGPLASLDLPSFTESVAADTPAPGGGSVAALSGALGASLAAMVANLTVGKKGYEASFAVLSGMAVEAQALRERLLSLVDDDSRAFDLVMEASRMPKATEAQKKERDEALDAANRKAALLPMETARDCLAALEKLLLAVKLGNRNSVSDGVVGALMAYAGLEGALMNTKVNLKSIPDASFRESLSTESGMIAEKAAGLFQNIKEEARKILEL